MESLIIVIVLIVIGYIAGNWAESRHYRSIEEREKALLAIPAMASQRGHVSEEQIESALLVHGSAVISVDYFKRILAGLKNIVGGRVSSYETLLDRARREAILRMKEMAPDADLIVNVRIETATIGRGRGNKGTACVEALAYGTAIKAKSLP